MIELRAPGLVLDAPVSTDAGRVYEYCQDPLFERFLTVPWPYTRLDASRFVDEFVPAQAASAREEIWAIRSAAGMPLLGVISLRAPIGMVGFWLGAPHRGSGVMTRALTAVIDHAFATRFEAVRWECVEGNAASLAVARACGFRYTGLSPADVPARDGTRPPAWKGELRAGDDRARKPGWPA